MGNNIIGPKEAYFGTCHKTNLLRHSLDVMHIEKFFLDNIINTVIDVKGKIKDNVKARLDLAEHCRQPELELQVSTNGKVVKPKANYAFTLEYKKALCEWVKEFEMPYGYTSYMSNCVDMSNATLSGMKSHDCMCLWSLYFRRLSVDYPNMYGSL